MDYEKKYKEIVGQIKKAYLYAQTDSTKAVLEEIFPELKEFEDERIRKAIIATIHLYYGEPLEDEAKEMLAWLGKQGEQKPVVIIPKFRIGDNIKTTNEEPLIITKIDGKGYWSEDLLVCDFDDAAKWELVEHNPDDKTEPKFKVGDFIVNDYCMGKVIELTGDTYLLDTGQGIPFSFEHNAHLWTIADAKDGDVLYHKSENGIEYIVMSKGLNEFGNIDSYCRYNSIGGFGIDIPSVLSAKCYSITPATKEQRDTLFAKMHEAGYIWDSESRQLLSLKAEPSGEQKPAWSEEDEEELFNAVYACLNFYGKDSDTTDWLKSLKQRIGG